jgi:SAM-dependent methyltransferase
MKEAAVFEQSRTIERWDSDYYHPIAQRYYDRAIFALLKLIGAVKGATVLDAGCGPGVHSIRVARAGCRVIAVDFSDAMLREGQARISAAGVDSAVEFRKEDLTKLSFPDASFHHVFSWGVIIHIRDVEKALDELCRVVTPGGFLGLYVTNKHSWDQKVDNFMRLVLRKSRPREDHPIGSGRWYQLHGELIWVWQFDISVLIRQIESRGMTCTHRGIGELFELQRHFRGPMRRSILRLNNLCYRLGLPPGPAASNLLIFRKT